MHLSSATTVPSKRLLALRPWCHPVDSGVTRKIKAQVLRSLIAFLPAAFLPALFASFVNTAFAQALRSDSDLGAQWRLNSTARLMAGLSPWHPAHIEFSRADAWKEHSAAMQSAWNQVTNSRVKPMSQWRENAMPPACPAGKTLLYPFSGPDFFNAYWLFPDCDTYVMFGLEHIGDLPNIENMNEKQLVRLMADVRTATGDLFDRNYFITENMARQLYTPHLRGVVPLIALEMALSGMDILRVVPFDLNKGTTPIDVAAAEGAINAPDAAQAASPPQRPLRQLKSVAIDFRVGDSGKLKRLIYFSTDATDAGLARYPQFLAFLRGLGTTTTLIKSASYLLHSRNFRVLRNTLLDVTGYLVQDDSGMPYSYLASNAWDVRLHGTYSIPIPPFEGAFQPALSTAFKSRGTTPLPFPFGYSFRDQRDERSNIIIGVRTQRQQTAAAPAERATPAPRTRSRARSGGGA